MGTLERVAGTRTGRSRSRREMQIGTRFRRSGRTRCPRQSKAGRQEITRADREAVIDQCDLWLPPEARPSVHVYLTTIKEQKFDIPAHDTLDWRHYFVDRPGVRRHEPKDPADWDGKKLPELRALEAQISKTTDRLIRPAAWRAYRRGSPSGRSSATSPATRSRWTSRDSFGRATHRPAPTSS